MRDDLEKRLYSLIEEAWDSGEEYFVPGETFITTGFAIYGPPEIWSILDTLFEKRLGLSRRGKEFEREFAKYIGTRYAITTNSGSSASLLALEGVKQRRKLEGGEVITTACGFPTALNPIIQLGFKPVFVDIDDTLNATPEGIYNAIGKDTKGIVFAHTLGNPAQVREITDLASERGIFTLEDTCDAYGSLYDGKKCGSFGTVSSYSFYPAHNITLAGEGGAITTSDIELTTIIKSLRDWGRDCYCEAWQDNTCGIRFDHQIGGIDYDHKYIFSRIGYNMKPTELQAAMGLRQLERIEVFNQKRRENFNKLREVFSNFEDYFEFPRINEKADPVFFGFPIIIRDQRIDRKDMVEFLNQNKIGTRYIFGGNLLHQPAYKGIDFRISGGLEQTEKVFRDLFWIGNHPGMGDAEISYIGEKVGEYLTSK